ncbi:hypothetical protein PHYPSEUDO_006414 [Phytophthora pseudosyringae]|uniref:Uncharacterized protein n=1 Tax=Phytophthora pseudosyringae TaxID=221518 RepID=A0A8T1VM62_9STRA|nr:hypothetical protein PHYPSEUDO_006414 [Phytophthora pseudosyringae]
MEVQVDTMPINQSSKKRKSLFSAASPITPRVPACGPMPVATPLTAAPASDASADGANLSAALTALKLSLKRDLESFAPPTPAVSPAHGRGPAKRARFDFGSIEEEVEADAEEQQRVMASAVAAPPKTVNALLAVSSRIKFELEKRRRRDRERAQKPRRRKQLSYFAIVGAFQRAAHEREVAVQLECVVEASTD